MSAGRWSDLGPRVVSGLVLALIGLGAVWLGGFWLLILLLAVAGIAAWELGSVLGSERPVLSGLLAVGALGAGAMLQTLSFASSFEAVASFGLQPVAIILAMSGALLAAPFSPRENVVIQIGYGAFFQFALFSLFALSVLFGAYGILILIGIVVLTDIAGYFAGRILGGPKFWPSLSPKKTWSGSVAGWLASALLVLWLMPGDWFWAVPLAMAISFASQMGDIGASAIKRRMGVKDYSNIIPGHGGVLDRFDGLAAAFALAGLALIVGHWMGHI